MKYPIHNKPAYFLIRCIDWFLHQWVTSQNVPIKNIKKIVICNTAHLGDVILTTGLLSAVRDALPQAHIAMLVGSWSKLILEGHPHVNRVYLIDHWKVSRRKEILLMKFLRYLKMRRHALRELRTYDLAIDCGLHFPNMAPLLWSAGIPIRIGFASAGFGSLLTHALPWDPYENCSIAQTYLSLLEPLNIRKIPAYYPILHTSMPKPQNYWVVHMGSGNPKKNWPEAHWKELIIPLVAEGEEIVFTGIGESENAAIERIRVHVPNTKNLCNQLSWHDFVKMIQNAALLIATDTCAGHIAAATCTPAILLYTAIHPTNMWRPCGKEQQILTHPMPCSPCLKGCNSMTCIRELSVNTVYNTIRSVKPKHSS